MVGAAVTSASQDTAAPRAVADVATTPTPSATPTPTPTPTPVVEVSEVSKDFPIHFRKTTIDDPTLAKGQTRLQTAGVDGVLTRTYRVTTTDGVETDRPTDLLDVWRDDLVTFVIGCSFTFESALVAEGIRMAHQDAGVNVPMYRTTRRCASAGRLSGPLVVSMRPLPADRVADAVRITSRYLAVHGAPVHVGDPAGLGITDLSAPDFGDAVEVPQGHLPVFWACGVTPQAAIMESRPPLAITHAPGHMLITDLPDRMFQVP